MDPVGTYLSTMEIISSNMRQYLSDALEPGLFFPVFAVFDLRYLVRLSLGSSCSSDDAASAAAVAAASAVPNAAAVAAAVVGDQSRCHRCCV